MTVTQRLFGIKCAGNFAQANATIAAADGTLNIIATDPVYFVNGINNVAINGPVEIDYTLFSIGTAATIAPVLPANGWYVLQIP